MDVNAIQLNTFRPLRAGQGTVEQQVQEAKELQETFRTFVGESFFGQMLKSMKSTVGKPAYFHGGRAEEIFQGQLNQSMAEDMTKASADTIADPMFRQQFPQQAKLLREAEENQKSGFADLDQLRRR
ncbi:MAG: hypothetical protein GXP26_14490 [Planctomycetes bacterium]|nr:hypothetical protein [Planctomycetota bacterium]